ncbi:MAG: NADH-ubiquinone oxidoreductase-F iron-sulfur binding region domain-containing protein [Streptosporangiaceae bacterium]
MSAQPDMSGSLRTPVARLTAGWQDIRRPATLREHADRYGPMPAAASRGQHALLDEVSAAGLTGRGGAGFPTGTKMRAVALRRGPSVVVANGMESEPVSEKDQALLARAPQLVLDGIELAAEAVGATEAHLCLPVNRQWLIDQVHAAIGQRRQAGFGGVPITVDEVPHQYVSSEETALVHWLNGGEAKPTTTPPRPFERGVGKRPTLLDNVETLAHVALIARYGASWFRQAGTADTAGTMLTTLTGSVAQPGVYEIEAGVLVNDVLAMAGVRQDSQAVLIGGYFGTWHDIADVGELPFSTAGLRPAGAAPGAGVVVALPAGSCGVAEAARILRYLASEGAQQCGPCMFGLPAIADDMAQLASNRPEGDPLERMRRRFAQIAGRGACRHPDGAVRMASSALSAFGADAHAHARRRSCLAANRLETRRQAGHRPPDRHDEDRATVLARIRPGADGSQVRAEGGRK